MASSTSSISSSSSDLTQVRTPSSEQASTLPAALAAISLVNTPAPSPTAPMSSSSAAASAASNPRLGHPLFAPLEAKGIFAPATSSGQAPRTCVAIARPSDTFAEFQELYAETSSLRDPSLSSIGRDAVYRNRNRYRDIHSADQWLFRLSDPRGELPFNTWKEQMLSYSDIGHCPYINASCMGSYQGDIITQGPLANTVAQFWNMVWLAKIPVIVMLTPFMESNINKCDEYFPDNIGETMTCGYQSPHRLKLLRKDTQNGFVERTLVLMKDTETREITHVHCSDWSDQQAYPIDRLMRLVEHVYQAANGVPFTSLCSAGAGRTGAFYTCYLIHSYWKQNGSLQVNVRELVKFLRTFRPELIQKPSQYAIIFEFIETLNQHR